eukprot:76940-Prymnesium_polylepis.3
MTRAASCCSRESSSVSVAGAAARVAGRTGDDASSPRKSASIGCISPIASPIRAAAASTPSRKSCRACARSLRLRWRRGKGGSLTIGHSSDSVACRLRKSLSKRTSTCSSPASIACASPVHTRYWASPHKPKQPCSWLTETWMRLWRGSGADGAVSRACCECLRGVEGRRTAAGQGTHGTDSAHRAAAVAACGTTAFSAVNRRERRGGRVWLRVDHLQPRRLDRRHEGHRAAQASRHLTSDRSCRATTHARVSATQTRARALCVAGEKASADVA